MVRNNPDNPPDTAVILWAFLTVSDLAQVLSGSELPEGARQKLLEEWPQAEIRRAKLSQDLPVASFREPNEAELAHLQQFMPGLEVLKTQIASARFAFVLVEQLINPLTMIDFEYVDELRASLPNTTPNELARFALASHLAIQLKTNIDASGRAVNVVSGARTLTFGQITVNQLPGLGIEVKVPILATPQFIAVTKIGDRLCLRNGMHRAYLLASLGIKEIPCVLNDEEQMPTVVGPYPTFAPHVLSASRPPLLKDMFDPTLTRKIPVAKTTVLLRVAADTIALPRDPQP